MTKAKPATVLLTDNAIFLSGKKKKVFAGCDILYVYHSMHVTYISLKWKYQGLELELC